MSDNRITLSKPGPPLSIDEIALFESEIGGRLPDDYKAFLLTNNGGFIEPPMGFHCNGVLNEVPAFDELLPTSEYGIRRGLWDMHELKIDGFLPIASTLNEEDICIDFKKTSGNISLALYARDHDVAVRADFVPIANTFTDFLDMLVPIPEIYCPIQSLGEQGTPEDLQAYLDAGNSLDVVGKNGFSILCEAVKFNNSAIVRACIEHGANLSKSIHIAAKNRRLDAIKLLVDAGANVNEEDEFGCRPLGYVGGTALPGKMGSLNRELRDLLIASGAHK